MGHQTVLLITLIHPIYIGFDGSRTNGMAVAAQNVILSKFYNVLKYFS